jgi:TetR/AcrR family transcriptional repressor of nem operon
MSRPKEFDEAEVLDQAVELFRARGFQATSFCDLTAGLGISRQSLYDTYGDKQTLFEASLKRYRERSLDHIRRLLETPGPVRPVFVQLFQSSVSGACSKGNPGCFMVNSMVEMAPQDDAIRAMALAHARDLEGLFAARLSLAQRTGDLGKDKDPVALARYLYHTLLGLAVAARALGERDSLLQSGRLALLALD